MSNDMYGSVIKYGSLNHSLLMFLFDKAGSHRQQLLVKAIQDLVILYVISVLLFPIQFPAEADSMDP